MPDLWYPPGAHHAAAQAQTARAAYQAAALAIRTNRALSKPEKRQRLSILHRQHQRAMGDLRRQWKAAFLAAEQDAIRRLVRNRSANNSSLLMDSYRRRTEELWDKPIEQLVHAFDLAELMDDFIGMQAAGVVALLRHRMPGLPGDKATALVQRFAMHRWPDGRWEFPDASIGWENLLRLEQWERADHLAAEAVFSYAANPEPPDDPRPRDPHQEALDDVASLYRGGNGQVAAAAAGGGSEPPAAS